MKENRFEYRVTEDPGRIWQVVKSKPGLPCDYLRRNKGFLEQERGVGEKTNC